MELNLIKRTKKRLGLVRQGVSIRDKLKIIYFFLNRKKINECCARISRKSILKIRKNNPNDLWMCDIDMDKSFFNLVKKIRPEKIIDIGANIGRYSIHFSEIENSKVICFEPQKDNFKALEGNISLNKRKNISPYNQGIFDKNTKLDLNICEENCGANSLVIERGGKKEKITVSKLDDFLKEKGFGKVDLIKIDVEGAEINVLKGAKETIKKYHPIIFLEILEDKQEIFDFLLSNGYKISDFGGDNYLAN
jgi:FkbM family methyltransferase